MPELKARAHTLNELARGAAFLFACRPLALDPTAEALLTPEARALLGELQAVLERENRWTTESLEATLKAQAEQRGLGLGKLAQPLRAALTGATTSPGIFDVLALLGKEEALARLGDQLAAAPASDS
jgi:glutamyl-tRNA synthetase